MAASAAGSTTRSRRTRVWAARIAWPERRRIAPRLAPVRNSTPAIVRKTPRIVAPEEPRPRPTSRASSLPSRPPWSAPSVSIRPVSATARPRRKGRTSTSALLATISAPSGTSTRGIRYAASPMPPAHEVGHRPAAEAEPEHRGEEDADPGQAEPDQLGMMVGRAGTPLALAAALPDPRGGFRGRPMDPLFPRHAVPFAAGAPPPPYGWLNAAQSIPK